MEVIVSCCIGVLTAVSLSGLLLWFDGAKVEASSIREIPEMIGKAMGKVAKAIGGFLVEMGLPSERTRARLSDELRRVSLHGHCPFSGLDDEAALGAIVLLSLGVGAALGILAWSPVGALIGLVAPTVVLQLRAASHERATKAKVSESMPEAFNALSISLESGLSLSQAMRYVGAHSEEPVRSEFQRASFAMSCGVPATEALGDMVDRLSAPGLELVTLALTISKRTGAPLKDLLAEASQLAGERIELARRLDVKTSQARMSAQIVAAMPVAMVGLLALLSSDFRSGLATTTGAVSVGIALAMNLAAWLIIRRIMKVEL